MKLMSPLLFHKYERPIFLFHRVNPRRDVMWDPTDPVLFEKVLQFLQKHFTILSLDELVESPIKRYAKPLTAISFDDGYLDFIEYALPLLKKYDIPSTMFIATECIDLQQPIWTYLVDNLFFHSKKTGLDASALGNLPEHLLRPKWLNGEERNAYGRQIKRHLKAAPATERNRILQELKSQLNDVEIPRNLIMTWADVSSIHAEGVQVAAHSVTHPTMDTLPDDKAIKFELQNAAKRIREETGIESKYFSYPNGSYNDKVLALTKEAGYDAAFAVGQQAYRKDSQDRFAIPRIEIYNGSWVKTVARLTGAFSLYQKLWNK